MATTRGSSGLLDFASLFLLVDLLGSFQAFDYRVITTLNKLASRNVTTKSFSSVLVFTRVTISAHSSRKTSVSAKPCII